MDNRLDYDEAVTIAIISLVESFFFPFRIFDNCFRYCVLPLCVIYTHVNHLGKFVKTPTQQVLNSCLFSEKISNGITQVVNT